MRRFAWLLAVPFLGGCVTVKECKRYAEVTRATGYIEGLAAGAAPWEDAYLGCERRATKPATFDEIGAQVAEQVNRELCVQELKMCQDNLRGFMKIKP